jgi:2-(1,2-epoxy-1,2-dihydrophenyl)acetyl-CoA isomerase
LTPDCGGSFILPRLVGWRRAIEMMMTGDAIGAEEALKLGMINKVVPDDQLMPQALALAESLAQSPTMALGRIKELLEASATNNFEQQLEFEREVQIKSGQTADFREGVAAFIEKRQPRFSGG